MIEWKYIQFICKPDQWFIEGYTCELLVTCNEWKSDTIINEGCGLFSGLTNETFSKYDGVLPRLDEEGCPFNEFNIYYNNVLINKLTYKEVLDLQKNI